MHDPPRTDSLPSPLAPLCQRAQGDPDPLALLFLEMRTQIDALRGLHPGRSDREMALAMLRASDSSDLDERGHLLAGLCGSALHFVAKFPGASS